MVRRGIKIVEEAEEPLSLQRKRERERERERERLWSRLFRSKNGLTLSSGVLSSRFGGPGGPEYGALFEPTENQKNRTEFL